MATLSKMVIESIAEKMTEKSKKYADGLKKEYQNAVLVFFEAQAPDEIKECFKKYPEYIETQSGAWLDGRGFNSESVSLGKQVPAYSRTLKLTAAISDKLIVLKRKWNKAQEDYKQLYQETESALFALKTHKNIKENLPEAIPYLPPPMSNSLIVNFDSLRKNLKKQPEIKTVATH